MSAQQGKKLIRNKIEICTSTNEETAAHPVTAHPVTRTIATDFHPIRYRLVIGGVGIVYDGESKPESRRRFRLFVTQSQTKGSRYCGEPVTLFKNYEILKEYEQGRIGE